jgi:hypothetical protein
MGILQRLVHILGKLDPGNKLWEDIQRKKAVEETEEAYKIGDKEKRNERLTEISDIFQQNSDDYGRKLFLIENCIYGIDIQPIAIQISKLRFFISLIVNQEKSKNKDDNYGIRPLPNLETKFVAANTLIGLDKAAKDALVLQDETLEKLQAELLEIRHQHFIAKTAKQKISLREHDKALCVKIEKYLLKNAGKPNKKIITFNTAEIESCKRELKDLPEEWAEEGTEPKLFDDGAKEALFRVDKNKDKRDALQSEINRLQNEIQKEQEKSVPAGFDKEITKTLDWNPYDQMKVSPFFEPFWMFGVADGFDVVIGNPPYVEAKKLKYISSLLKESYEVYSGTADFSVYFIERGLNFCRKNSILMFITTNKFFNTGYGKLVRSFILKNQIYTILDFEQVEVFENALVSSVVLGIKNTTATINDFSYHKYYKLKSHEFKEQFGTTQKVIGTYKQSLLSEQEWSFSDTKQLALKEKIEQSCKRIYEINGINVYRGVTTGYNPAFIVDNAKRKELITADVKNKEIIKPMLQGRNIRKWVYNESNDYLLQTGYDVNIKKGFPLIFKHLESFKTELVDRADQGVDWWNLRACKYYGQFEKEKIIWGLTADKLAFAYDDKKHYLPSNGYILTSTVVPVKYLLALLNSKLLKYYFDFIGVMTAGGAYTLKHATIQQLPVKIANDTIPIVALVDQILVAKAADQKADTSGLETQIDTIVYRLYGLTYDEVKIIEPEFELTEMEYKAVEERG